MENKIKNPIRIYPLDLIKQAIIAAAFQNKARAASAGVCTEFTDEHKVAEAVLTNSKFDFSNYVPEDSSLPIIVMENSKLALLTETNSDIVFTKVKRVTDVPWNELEIGDTVVSCNYQPGKITELTSIEFAKRCEDNEVGITWALGSTSYDWYFFMKHVEYVGKGTVFTP